MGKRLWFKAKLFGWGWYPSTWEGWLVLLGYIALVCGHLYYLGLMEGGFANQVDYGSERIWEAAPFLVLYTAVLLWISYKKGEKPRWRWGK